MKNYIQFYKKKVGFPPFCKGVCVMKSFLNNKKIILILENRRIIPYIYSDNGELIKIYSLDIPDSEKNMMVLK